VVTEKTIFAIRIEKQTAEIFLVRRVQWYKDLATGRGQFIGRPLSSFKVREELCG
jgi:hypothetical protein